MSLIHSVARFLPDRHRAKIHFHRYPNLMEGWGGAFNGQCFRQLMFMELLSEANFDAIFETGTYHGTTTSFMAQNAHIPIFTLETEAINFYYAKHRLRSYKNVTALLGDSRSLLRSVTYEHPWLLKATVFFYLDAHWYSGLPLQEEVAFITSAFQRAIIMIDDFEVPGDSGYGFDTYEGSPLALKNLHIESDDFLIAFPSRKAALESGAKRGCVVIGTPQMGKIMRRLPTLRIYDDVASSR